MLRFFQRLAFKSDFRSSSTCNALNLFFFSRILRSEALVHNSFFFFFSEKPFYRNYSTLDSHTNTVISHAVAFSSSWLPKP